MNKKKYSTSIFLCIFYLSICCCKSSTHIETLNKENSFYDTLSYYHESPLLKYFDQNQFILWDELGFLQDKNYSTYLIYYVYNEHFKGKYGIYSIKVVANDSDYINIMSYSNIIYNNGHVFFESNWHPATVFSKYAYANNKISLKIGNETIASVNKTLEKITMNIHSYKKPISYSETYRTIFYLNRGKYYLINPSFINQKTMDSLCDYLMSDVFAKLR